MIFLASASACLKLDEFHLAILCDFQRLATMTRPLHTALFATLAFVSAANAGVLWNETVQGDLSNDWLSPTVAQLVASEEGENILSGLTGDDGTGVDRDYITVTIPAGAELTGIILQDYFSPDFNMFMGVVAGTTVVNPEEATDQSVLGYALFGPTDVGIDLMDELGIARYPGGGFVAPVGPGTYTFWIQQTGEPTIYQMNFIVVPAPGALAFASVLLLPVARRRRVS